METTWKSARAGGQSQKQQIPSPSASLRGYGSAQLWATCLDSKPRFTVSPQTGCLSAPQLPSLQGGDNSVTHSLPRVTVSTCTLGLCVRCRNTL